MHHAVLYIGEREQTHSHLESLFAELGVRMIGNPDVFLLNQEVFAVDDARLLSERSIEKAFGDKKYFIIKAEKFTTEAQNALLKTLEDPVADTHFIITARDKNIFLPTLLSRLSVTLVGGEVDESNAKKFLKKSLKQRIDFAKKFADEATAGSLAEFLDSLILELKSSGTKAKVLKKVLKLRVFASDTGAMPRLMIEHLALVI